MARTNPALAKLENDITVQGDMLAQMQDQNRDKTAEYETAKRHQEEVSRRIESWRLEDRDEDMRTEEMRRRNREAQGRLRDMQKERFLREQECGKMKSRLDDVEARGRQMAQVAEENKATLQVRCAALIMPAHCFFWCGQALLCRPACRSGWVTRWTTSTTCRRRPTASRPT